ncbi:MAG: chemotaxis protein CheX [Selenomonadales bacterium]|nr:chemotaxis protein CheX [Selenomonadales bacterium]MDD7763124.1 chemotaxis protein CheX [Selenomonadales bacterium]
MDAKLVNPFVDAFTAVMPQIGFAEPKRTKMGVKAQNAVSLGVSVIVGFTKQIRGNIVYNMSEDTAKFIASTMMMGMPIENFDDMAQSAISEMSNMLTATAATNLAGMGLEVDISTPSLSIGQNFQVKISDTNYLTVEMDLAGHLVELDIAVEQQ